MHTSGIEMVQCHIMQAFKFKLLMTELHASGHGLAAPDGPPLASWLTLDVFSTPRSVVEREEWRLALTSYTSFHLGWRLSFTVLLWKSWLPICSTP